MPLTPDVPYRYVREGRAVARGVDRGGVTDDPDHDPGHPELAAEAELPVNGHRNSHRSST